MLGFFYCNEVCILSLQKWEKKEHDKKGEGERERLGGRKYHYVLRIVSIDHTLSVKTVKG